MCRIRFLLLFRLYAIERTCVSYREIKYVYNIELLIKRHETKAL